ncbi:MAG: Golgi-to-ER vesicle coat component [Watsoniomyces obsoletus]|nr:MAG: Golgi-to-ER vesicle coat component [Watsoniomyces obsoletus]
MSEVHNPEEEQENADAILLAARYHHVDHLRSLLQTGSANAQDPETGCSALHLAISSLGPSDDEDDGPPQLINGHETNSENQEKDGSKFTSESKLPEEKLEAAKQTVALLFQNGAIWNDLNKNGETPGCIAHRLGLTEIYDMVVDAGVRAEILLSRLEEYERLDDNDDDNDDDEEDGEKDNDVPEARSEEKPAMETSKVQGSATGDQSKDVTTNEEYLQSTLSFSKDRILDGDNNGVMMAWETDIMKRSADLLFSSFLNSTSTTQDPSEPQPEEGQVTDQQTPPKGEQSDESKDIKVLNIGHGMGIIDRYIQTEYHPSTHHIVEAHPSILSKLSNEGWKDKKGVKIHQGRWQDVLPDLLEKGEMFDVIYFDTFAEDYSALRRFFQEFVTGLLSSDGDGGRWGFFNGLGADRRVCYDVYTKVLELDLYEAGFEVDWVDVPVPEEIRRDEYWDGVRRKYFNVDTYRLPICRFIS